MSNATPDRVQMIVPPPVVFLAALGGAVLLHVLTRAAAIAADVAVPVGVAVLVLAVAGLAWAVRTMFAAGESPEPARATQRVVRHGPFARSRNPVYLTMTLAVIGISLAVGADWGVPLALLAALVVDRIAIRPEERYLESKFGDDYLSYCRQVRRWL